MSLLASVLLTAASARPDSPDCAQSPASILDVNFLGTVQNEFCSLDRFRERSARAGILNPVILVQMGLIDDPNGRDRLRSDDDTILRALDDFLTSDACGFVRNTAPHTYSKAFGQRTITLRAQPASQDGKFNRKLSEFNATTFMNRAKEADYIVYIGHSRLGKGMDLFPLVVKQRPKPISIYSAAWVESLPSRVKGIGVLACDPLNHAQVSGAIAASRNRGIAFVGVKQKAFDFRKSLSSLIEVLEEL